MATKTERVTARVNEHVFETLTRAADLVGSTMNQFLIQSALERAQKVIEEQDIIRLSAKDSERFFDAMDNPPQPNDKLLEAFRLHKDQF